MAITQTTLVPKTADGAGGSLMIIALTPDTAYPTGGYAISTSDFSTVHGAEHIGSKAVADNGYASRFLVTGGVLYWTVWQNYNPGGAGAADRVDIEYPNGTDLVANLVGPINVLVYGV
jgi:hypothetical protein